MTNKEKQLLLIDLCARLPYGVRIKRETITGSYARIEFTLSLETFGVLKIGIQEDRYSIKPYLRPMSSMTEEEKKEVVKLGVCYDCAFHNDIYDTGISMEEAFFVISWFLERHFDINHLIEKGLAIEAKPEMYKI
jgi:hypothetical protein